MVDPLKTREIEMESIIEDYLVDKNNYISREYTKYDKDLCIDSDLVLKFIYATQPNEWEKLKEQHGERVKEKFLKRLYNEIERRGTLDVLRKGIKDYGSHFDLFYSRPASKMNETYQKLFQANLWSVMRQVHFSTKNNKSLDMVLFINGLPIITIELKDKLSGSSYSVDNAIKQYKTDRDPKEPLFKFERCLVHFAVDEDLVYMTTRLEGGKTTFLPFNKGRDDGSGNPDTQGFKTEYLWKEIFTKEILSDILKDFLLVQDIIDEDGRKTGEKLIFPRYHQLDAVRKMVKTAQKVGPGKNYLIQHSAGSGKSNTIAWLCHKLSSLHDDNDKIIFDSIIVVTDRIVLDKQLQGTIKQFAQVGGVVEGIEKGSKQLREALEKGKKIIVTTIQKFPFIVEDLKVLPGKNFAVVVDEAHSGQSGETSKYLKQTLKYGSLEEAEKAEKDDRTWEDELNREIESRGRLKNVSYFAFTATPKNKTFELFGEKLPDGKYKAFHLYSMRQAIEEGFILDVLRNYTTYKTYFHMLKIIENDPNYDRKKATRLLRNFVELKEHTINKKVEIIVEHFNDYVKDKIPDNKGIGHAKAMIVTRSRLHAVKYKIAMDKYLRENGYPYKALVAFSGKLKDEYGIEHTESGMNGFSDKQTVSEYKKSKNKFLIVAEKFQTGFDQPLLYAMYVDKILSGIAAVQTLSRTNRVYPNKEEPLILDFTNDADDIQRSFEPYYEETILSKGTDQNKLYDLQHKLENFYIYTHEDIEEFAKLYFDPKVRQDKLNPILNKVMEIFCKLPGEDQDEFKSLLKDYNRLYAFISQVITFSDLELEKLYVFGRMLARKLPADKKERLPLEVTEQIDLDALRIQKINEGSISLNQGDEIHSPEYNGKSGIRVVEKEPLSKIVEALNDKYGTEFGEADKLILQRLEERVISNDALMKSIKVNPKDKVKMTFDHVFEDELQGMVDENFDFYQKVNDNKEIRESLVERMFEFIYRKLAKI